MRRKTEMIERDQYGILVAIERCSDLIVTHEQQREGPIEIRLEYGKAAMWDDLFESRRKGLGLEYHYWQIKRQSTDLKQEVMIDLFRSLYKSAHIHMAHLGLRDSVTTRGVGELRILRELARRVKKPQIDLVYLESELNSIEKQWCALVQVAIGASDIMEALLLLKRFEVDFLGDERQIRELSISRLAVLYSKPEIVWASMHSLLSQSPDGAVAIDYDFLYDSVLKNADIGIRDTSHGSQGLRPRLRRAADPVASKPDDAYIDAEEGAKSDRRYLFDHLIESHTRLFAGRRAELGEILRFLDTNKGGYIFVEAFSGYGKTSLLAKLAKDYPEFTYHFISKAYKVQGMDFDPTDEYSITTNLVQQLSPGSLTDGERLPARKLLHQLLRQKPQKRQVILLDAIDEVDNSFLYGLLPHQLPEQIFVVLSARTIGTTDYLSEIGLSQIDVARHIILPGLDLEAIRDLLFTAGGQARSFAQNESSVDKLLEVSKGDPFYLRFLIEDIELGTISHDNIADMPAALISYLDLQFDILDRSAHLPQQRDIIGIIIKSYGPLSRSELIAMVEGLDALNFTNVLRGIRRFLLQLEGYRFTFCHNRFREYFLTKIS